MRRQFLSKYDSAAKVSALSPNFAEAKNCHFPSFSDMIGMLPFLSAARLQVDIRKYLLNALKVQSAYFVAHSLQQP